MYCVHHLFSIRRVIDVNYVMVQTESRVLTVLCLTHCTERF